MHGIPRLYSHSNIYFVPIPKTTIPIPIPLTACRWSMSALGASGSNSTNLEGSWMISACKFAQFSLLSPMQFYQQYIQHLSESGSPCKNPVTCADTASWTR